MNFWLPGHIAIFKMDDQQGPTICSTWNSAQCYVAAWMGGEFEGECIHVYLWLSLCGSLEPVTTLFVNQLCAVLCLVAQSRPTLHDPMDCSPPGSSVLGDSPGKNTGVDCYSLFQGIFPTRDQTQVSCIAGRKMV